MKQLQLWTLEKKVFSPIENESRARQEVIAIMAEAIVATIQRKQEESDEYVEESKNSR